ncbi:MAG: type II toxin-antitoxin system VapC family toxin [Blastocatellales bacterium]
MAFTIVDTNILIDSGRGDNDAIACLQRLEQQSTLATSAVTQMELIVGCRNKTELHDLEIFLRRFQILKITDQISDRAVALLQQYRLSHGLLIADALIAATGLEHNEPFITKNQRDFRFIAGLNLQPYP